MLFFSCYYYFSNFTDMHTEVNKSEIIWPKLLTLKEELKRWEEKMAEQILEKRVCPWPLGVSGHSQTLFIPSLPARMVQPLGPQAQQHRATTGTAPRPSHPGRGKKCEGHSADLAGNIMSCPGYPQGSRHQAQCGVQQPGAHTGPFLFLHAA